MLLFFKRQLKCFLSTIYWLRNFNVLLKCIFKFYIGLPNVQTKRSCKFVILSEQFLISPVIYYLKKEKYSSTPTYIDIDQYTRFRLGNFSFALKVKHLPSLITLNKCLTLLNNNRVKYLTGLSKAKIFRLGVDGLSFEMLRIYLTSRTSLISGELIAPNQIL